MFADETETPLTPAELAALDQFNAAGLDRNRAACAAGRHCRARGFCLRCGDNNPDAPLDEDATTGRWIDVPIPAA